MHFSIKTVATALLITPILAQTWTDLAPIPVGTLQEHITLSLTPTLLATLGGLLSDGATTNSVLLYDIPRNTWKLSAPIPVALNHPNAIVYNAKIYLLGGLTGDNDWRATPNAWVYDPDRDAWSTLTTMPVAEARGSAASAVYNGTIYLAGGIPKGGGPTLDIVSAYDVAADQWIVLPEKAGRLPGARDHAGYAQIGSKMYVLGGRENGVTATKDTVLVLDLADLALGWKEAEGKMPTPRGGLVAAAIESKIYTFGGEGNQAPNTRGVFNQTEVYDVVADSWTRLPGMKLPRHGTSAVASGGRIYIPGGGIVQGAGATDIFDVFTP